MPEGQQYDPVIEKHLETSGLDVGRFKNNELARDLARHQNAGTEPQMIDAMAKNSLAGKTIDQENIAAQMINALDVSPSSAEIERQFIHRELDSNLDRIPGVVEQYDELRTKAKTIGDAHKEEA